MTSLYRCRGSLSEFARTFSCEVPHALDWSPTIMPGYMGLVIRRTENGRALTPMRWGLPDRARSARTVHATRRLMSPLGYADRTDPPERVLVLADCFALPHGPRGNRQQAWLGLWDCPLFAMAGLCREGADGPSFVVMLTSANALVAHISATMPVILDAADQAIWLDGAFIEAARCCRAQPQTAMYLEAMEEPWPGRRTRRTRPIPPPTLPHRMF